MQLPSSRHGRFITAELPVKRTLLMRVFAIPQILNLLELQGQKRREFDRAGGILSLQITGDHAVITGGMLKHFSGQLPARLL